MKVTRYRAGDRRLLAVDAEHYVPDRTAFATRLCDPESGVAAGAPPDGPTAEQPAITGGSGTGQPAAADRSARDRRPVERVTGADAVCFLALEPEFRPPRVVVTVVRPDGERPAFCPHAARCGARWAADRTGDSRVMLDTQAGTRAARIHDDGGVSVEMADPTAADRDDPAMERAPVVAELTAEVATGQ